MADYPVTVEIRIDWSELDLFGHVNNVMFFKYIQAARVRYWETIGLTQLFAQTNIGPILASTACQFRKPLHYPGAIRVQTRMEFIKNSSFGLQHSIVDGNGDLAAEAQDVVVVYDFTHGQKVPFPLGIRAAVEAIEKRIF